MDKRTFSNPVTAAEASAAFGPVRILGREIRRDGLENLQGILLPELDGVLLPDTASGGDYWRKEPAFFLPCDCPKEWLPVETLILWWDALAPESRLHTDLMLYKAGATAARIEDIRREAWADDALKALYNLYPAQPSRALAGMYPMGGPPSRPIELPPGLWEFADRQMKSGCNINGAPAKGQRDIRIFHVHGQLQRCGLRRPRGAQVGSGMAYRCRRACRYDRLEGRGRPVDTEDSEGNEKGPINAACGRKRGPATSIPAARRIAAKSPACFGLHAPPRIREHGIFKTLEIAMQTPQPVLIALPEVEKIVSLKRTAIHRAMRQSDFPKPIRIGGKAVRWYRAEVEAWLADRPRVQYPN